MTTVLVYVIAIFAFLVLAAISILAVLLLRDREHIRSLHTAEAARKDSQERADRLTEALGRKAGIDLILPPPRSQELEPSASWWTKKVSAKPADKEKN